jgi:hypothetical protein
MPNPVFRRPRGNVGPELAPGMNRGPTVQKSLPWVPDFAGMTKGGVGTKC